MITPGPWEQISGKYISIDNGQSPQVFVQATEDDLRLMRASKAMLGACRSAVHAIGECTLKHEEWHCDTGTHCHEALKALLAAIAFAEGDDK